MTISPQASRNASGGMSGPKPTSFVWLSDRSDQPKHLIGPANVVIDQGQRVLRRLAITSTSIPPPAFSVCLFPLAAQRGAAHPLAELNLVESGLSGLYRWEALAVRGSLTHPWLVPASNSPQVLPFSFNTCSARRSSVTSPSSAVFASEGNYWTWICPCGQSSRLQSPHSLRFSTRNQSFSTGVTRGRRNPWAQD